MLGPDFIKNQVADSVKVKQQILATESLLNDIHNAAEVCCNALRNGNKILLAGNGGSAADAQHISAEFVSRFEFDRPGLPSIALTTDSSIVTAIANDYGYEKLFSRQIQAQGRAGDVFIGISTSGNSANILHGFEEAKRLGIYTIGLAGTGGRIQTEADLCLSMPSEHTPRIQEAHILVGHIICAYVEKKHFPEHDPNKSLDL